jgi:hypothetical protein
MEFQPAFTLKFVAKMVIAALKIIAISRPENVFSILLLQPNVIHARLLPIVMIGQRNTILQLTARRLTAKITFAEKDHLKIRALVLLQYVLTVLPLFANLQNASLVTITSQLAYTQTKLALTTTNAHWIPAILKPGTAFIPSIKLLNANLAKQTLTALNTELIINLKLAVLFQFALQLIIVIPNLLPIKPFANNKNAVKMQIVLHGQPVRRSQINASLLSVTQELAALDQLMILKFAPLQSAMSANLQIHVKLQPASFKTESTSAIMNKSNVMMVSHAQRILAISLENVYSQMLIVPFALRTKIVLALVSLKRLTSAKKQYVI